MGVTRCPKCNAEPDKVESVLASPNDGSEDPEYYANTCKICGYYWEVH